MRQATERTTSARYERKLLAPPHRALLVDGLLRLHPAGFTEVYPPRFVNSIYLDTAGMDAYRDARDGRHLRSKYRLRWYGDLSGNIRAPILECKIRKGALGRKARLTIPAFVLDEAFDRSALSKLLRHLALPHLHRERLRPLVPVLVNRYHRRYFLSADGRYRVTLDDEQICFAAGRKLGRFLGGLRDDEGTVIEVKYEAAHDDEAHVVIGAFPFHLSRHSKYARAVERLALGVVSC